MRESGLYIHIPFCIEKCYYCDFNSVALNNNNLIIKFLKALDKEIELLANKYKHKIKTIFIGGGTPTVLSGVQINDIITKCQQQFYCGDDIEITIEANPGTVDEEKLRIIKEAGINRLSFGIQSFDDYFLEQIGRIHTVQDAVDNYFLSRKVGFSNINFDLMFALPGQNLKDWEATLDFAFQLAPDHLSTYNLKFEEGTLFYQWLQEGKLNAASEELDLKMYQLVEEKLEKQGYNKYEISNFAKSNKECLHNKLYWLNQSYLALGPGAHFYDGVGRGYNQQNISDYCQQIKQGKLPIVNYNKLSLEEKVEETMMLGLRLKEGISMVDFAIKYDNSIFDFYEDEISKLRQKGLLDINKGRVYLTSQGILLANRVLAEFLL
ncbi:putative oxygen-independent coproporphyrinogen III oxidase [Halobacteroides halobius DSM 5150]|uniref:Heme chaperone HemW n=1 Tax=Halobacteroides halobius (strain ATCC 35273 / DSM 5150 / MD-1) TaxID=748449 RepID=L0K969_HALHC|nr:radical SAM family heme chaperone HemW [Halobacteroides halobius]AGB41812.1 putative oxygen-independent coproporphyrinogen III oxidase [Halobacteroides halobius DSM 5150]